MKVFAFITVTLIGVALAGKPISVDPGTGPSGTGADISDAGLTNDFCALDGKECAGSNLSGSGKFAPTPRQCLIRCAKNVNCLTAFYSKEKKCYLRSKRCAVNGLKASQGLDLYRLKKKEKCPANRPGFVASTIKYSNSFCMMWGKKCSAEKLYPKPQRIASAMKCMEKCAKLSTCGYVDYTDGFCSPMEACAEGSLETDAKYRNYQRLEAGVNQCGPGRVEPSEHKPVKPPTEPVPKPQPVSVPPKPAYCLQRNLNCMFHDTQFLAFIFTPERCGEFCTASDSCKSFFSGPLGGCWLKNYVCENHELIPSHGHTGVKVKEGDDCSEYNPKPNYCTRRNNNCLFHDVKVYALMLNRDHCEYFCNYQKDCKSLYFDNLLHICYLKDYVCDGRFNKLFSFTGDVSVKLADENSDFDC